MNYYFSTVLHTNFDDAIDRVTRSLASEGFGVLSDIDVQATLKKKIDVDFRKYRILGACNPQFAYKALSEEDMIGTMLPCSVVVQEKSPGVVDVAVIDPIASMMAVKNDALLPIAAEVQQKLKRVIEKLQ
jgi:uncharacterized protein (DUF302 family)